MEKEGRDAGKRMKGQLIFEFIVAALFFFFIMIYVINYLNTNVDTFATASYQGSLQANANRIAELLVHSQGDWAALPGAAVGLEKSWQVLDSYKIGRLQELCDTDYASLLDKLDLGSKPFGTYKTRIRVYNATQDVLLCGPTPSGEFIGEAKRVALSDNASYLWAEVSVW